MANCQVKLTNKQITNICEIGNIIWVHAWFWLLILIKFAMQCKRLNSWLNERRLREEVKPKAMQFPIILIYKLTMLAVDSVIYQVRKSFLYYYYYVYDFLSLL